MKKAGRGFVVACTLAVCSSTLVGQLPIGGKQAARMGGEVPGQARASRYAFTTPRVLLGERLFSGVGTLVDMDLDGFRDFAFGGTFFLETGGTFSFFTIDEHQRKTSETRLKSPSKNPTHVFPHVVSADLNEDHLPDLIGIGRHGGIALHFRDLVKQENTNGRKVLGFRSRHYFPDATNASRVGAVSFSSQVIRIVDLDADGHEDLLLAGNFMGIEGIMNTSGLLWLRGDGRGGLARPQLLLGGQVISAEFADLNDDEAMDLVVLGPGGRVTLMTKRLGGYLVQKVKLTAIKNVQSLEVRDIDQDGIEDFILLGTCPQKDCFQAAIYLGLKDGQPGPGTIVRGKLSRKETIHSWLMEDLDSDGFPDLAMLCVDPLGRTRIEIFAGGREKPWSTRETLPLGVLLAYELSNNGTGYLKYEDIDGDGARDLWISPVRAKPDGLIGVAFLRNLRVADPPIRRIGTATATGTGIVPRISTAGGLPRIGNQRFAFRLSQVPGDQSLYWFWISHVRMDVRILGMQVKVFPFRTVLARSQGTGMRGGLVRLPFPIPLDKALVGEDFFFQWVFPSRGAKNPLSLARSEALQVRFLPETDRRFLPRLR